MTADVEPATATCWCCDERFAGRDVVRLGAHPEVAVCLDCAHDLKRRAVARRDERRRSVGGVVRAGIDRVRDVVIARGWHRNGLFGAFLQRLNRRLP